MSEFWHSTRHDLHRTRLFVAVQHAARREVELVSRFGLLPVDAYLLLSLASELRVSEIFDAPNWVASLHIPSRYLQL